MCSLATGQLDVSIQTNKQQAEEKSLSELTGADNEELACKQ